MITHYQVLGVNPRVTQEELRAAYLELANRHHPDKGGAHERFAEIATAYNALKTAARRAQYDQWLQLTSQFCNYCDGAGTRARQVTLSRVEHQPCAWCKGSGIKP